MRQDLEAQARTQGELLQILSGIETLKAAGAERRAVQHWSNLFVDELNVSLRRGRLSAAVEATIDVSSIDTRDANRDTHLRSPDFFDVEQFPTITFKSRSVTGADGAFRAVGDLTMHGVTHEVVLEVEELSQPTKDPWGNLRIGAVLESGPPVLYAADL